MLLVRPIHSIPFLQRHGFGVEAHIGRYDQRPGWDDYVPFVHGVHLPYGGLNLAAYDDEMRQKSIQAIKDAIENACQYQVDRMVIHTAGFKSQNNVEVGKYELMIESFKELAKFAAEKNIILCIENQVLREPEMRRIFGDHPAEWLQIYHDINHSNIMLTLDTSHAATSAAIYADHKKQLAVLDEFLAFPELIGRVHWSDARLANQEAKFNDMHLVPGTGDLPREFHQRINQLPVTKLLEQNCSEEEVEQALPFIASL